MQVGKWLQRRRGRGAPRQDAQGTLAQITEPDGRLVVLDQDGWQHIIEQHPEMAGHRADIMKVVSTPDHRGADPRPHRGRYWRREAGPSRWLMVVVDFGGMPARVVTAYGNRKDPPGWNP